MASWTSDSSPTVPLVALPTLLERDSLVDMVTAGQMKRVRDARLLPVYRGKGLAGSPVCVRVEADSCVIVTEWWKERRQNNRSNDGTRAIRGDRH